MHNHGRSKTSSETEKQHLATLITPERLHRCIVYDLDRTFESRFEIEADPPFAKVPWLRNRPVPKNRTGVTDGNSFILPIRNELLHTGNHLLWRQSRTGIKLAMNRVAGGKHFYVSSAYINNQHTHRVLVVDIGGTHVKVLATGHTVHR